MYQDKTLTCQDCGAPFVFSADDQSYHAQKGYTNEPKRCPTCRQVRRQQKTSGNGGFGGGSFDKPQREMYPAVCAQCGKDTQVPFRPSGVRPVYCSDCFGKQSAYNRR